VKIRGFRIELGEVDRPCGGPRRARRRRRRARGRDGQRLVAWVVPQEGGGRGGRPARCLAEALPDWLVPGAFVTLEALPLNTSGKLDRKALPAPDSPDLDSAYAQRNPVQGCW
jgi:acyl-CoA synthetase (AMP-forming)/AMP-acid ligase II